MADNKTTLTQEADEKSSTTVELPAELHTRAKVIVARGLADSLKSLIVDGLRVQVEKIETGR